MEPQDAFSHPREAAHRPSTSHPDADAPSAKTKPSAPTNSGGSRLITPEMTHILNSAQERLREYGSEFRAEIESDPQMSVVLERSASNRAGCRAGNDCLYQLAGKTYENRITHVYRICVEGAKSWTHWAPTKHYYHMTCFAQMMDVHTMIDDAKFWLRREPWGLIIRKWYESRGRVDLSRLQEYIEVHRAYKEAHSEFSGEWLEWQLKHVGSCKEGETCTCPPAPQPPEEPVLRDYKTAEDHVCGLVSVLQQENLEAMGEVQWVTLELDGRHASYVSPEKEDEEE
ncbi:hypothetical protein F5883DRAFT_618370 [Diaporthe sp. PMI_573]|nr:hypothetical protein F5883DRAFT_618370 [Diaporthaceae sp. PMI_573]